MLNSGIEILFAGRHWLRLAEGLSTTLWIAAASIALSFAFGLLLGWLRTFPFAPLRLASRLFLESIRAIPLLVWLYALYYVLPADLKVELSAKSVGILVFTLWGTAEMSDIARGALLAVPRHQSEAGLALGMAPWQLFRFVLLPQAARLILPGAINLAARMVMTTSLLFMLGVVEVIKVGQQVIEAASLENPMAAPWIYGLIFCFYFLLCWPLDRLSKRLLAPAHEHRP